MTIKQIYDLAIKMGIKNDLRGERAVAKRLKKLNEKYAKLSGEEKADFDKESLVNPYADSRVYCGHPAKPVKRILAGIDIDTGELMLAKELSKIKPIDLVISHHPLGCGLAGLSEVMDLQAEVYAMYGVPIHIAESLIKPRIAEVSRSVSGSNHNKTVDAAKLLGLSLMSLHTAADNLVANFLKKYVEKNKSKIEIVGDLVKLLKEIPEYQEACKIKAGPSIFAGSKEKRTGKIALTEITGGTSGSKDVYEKLSNAGIGTIVGMHMQEQWKNEAEKAHLSVVIAGHMSSDSLGMNLFLDELEKRGIEVLTCSGLIRISRNKKRK
ncbi:MAG: NGG1p interacting factor NIF3 [Patescibacteria group bacterium]|nr:NGG1p interacting factor NIF3 [Patescibacteria group bacterium]MDD5490970.1 NGG1p interacting factor NIF3 [Patescibacteria group bacterium]